MKSIVMKFIFLYLLSSSCFSFMTAAGVQTFTPIIKDAYEKSHYPARVEFLRYHLTGPDDGWEAPEALSFAFDASSRTLDLTQLTPENLSSLSDVDLQSLLGELAQLTVRVKWTDAHHHYRSFGWKYMVIPTFGQKVNGVVALILYLSTHKQEFVDIESRIIGLVPSTVSEELPKRARIILSEKVMASSLMVMARHVNNQNINSIVKPSGRLVQIYIKHWAKRSDKKLQMAINSLYLELIVLRPFDSIESKQFGFLLGTILTGAMNHIRTITKIDQNRTWVINSLSNIIWATTGFLGMVPWFAGNAAILIGTTVSLGVVVGAVIWNKAYEIRDFTSTVKEAKGKIKLGLEITGDELVKIIEKKMAFSTQIEETTILKEEMQKVHNRISDIRTFMGITLNLNGY